MEQLPICLNLKGRRVVVAGAGQQAARRACAAVRAGAKVLVVTCTETIAGNALDEVAEQPGATIRTGTITDAHLDGAILVFAATENPRENDRICRIARTRGILVSSDHADGCDFTMPSIIDRSPCS